MNSTVPVEYCRQKAAPPGSSFYYSTLLYPANIKRELYALHAFATELCELLTDCSDPGVARMKLGWWAEEVQRLQNNEARHPVTHELSFLKKRFPGLETTLSHLIYQYDQQINMFQPESYADLMNFLMQGTGLVWQLSAQICGVEHCNTPEIVAVIGCQIAWFDILQNSHRNSQLNRNYWPRDEISEGIDENEFYKVQINRLIKELDKEIQNINPVDCYSQLHAIIYAEIIISICREIKKTGFRLKQERINITPLRKLWIAWKTGRKIKKNL